MTTPPTTRPYAPSHTTSGGGIDPATECTCQRPYVTMAGPCPCPCHDYSASLRTWQRDGHERGRRYVDTGVCDCLRCTIEARP